MQFVDRCCKKYRVAEMQIWSLGRSSLTRRRRSHTPPTPAYVNELEIAVGAKTDLSIELYFEHIAMCLAVLAVAACLVTGVTGNRCVAARTAVSMKMVRDSVLSSAL